METTVKERLKIFIKSKNIGQAAFEKAVGLSNGYVNNIRRSIQPDKLQNIARCYPDLNTGWLMTGEGDMLKIGNKRLTHNPKGIPLIPVEAMAGYGSGDVSVTSYEIEENYILTPEFEGKGIKYLIRVSGSSMIPKYNNGDLLACRPITDISFMQWGKVYVLDTDQGPLVKRLYPCNPHDDDSLECRSDNYEKYPPFKIPKISIRKIAIVVGVLRLE